MDCPLLNRCTAPHYKTGCHKDGIECDILKTHIIYQTENEEKHSSISDRKAKAFDWMIKEMWDDELQILMEKSGMSTPLEEIEKAIIGETK